VSQHNAAQLYERVANAVQSGETAAVEAGLKEFVEDRDIPDLLLPAIDKLLSILGGDRDPGLADDPDLSFADAVELKLLLERLAESAA
jgi:hypothetical protein